jgi:hypothetical protein
MMTVEAPPRPPDHGDLRALIEEARRRARRRTRRAGVAVALTLLIAAGAYLLALRIGDTGTPSSAGSATSSPGGAAGRGGSVLVHADDRDDARSTVRKAPPGSHEPVRLSRLV